jgi:hypothetical protein
MSQQKEINLNLKKFKFLNFFSFFFWSGNLDPAYVRGVKHAGHYQITVVVSALSNPQVHELLIRCYYPYSIHTSYPHILHPYLYMSICVCILVHVHT